MCCRNIAKIYPSQKGAYHLVEIGLCFSRTFYNISQRRANILQSVAWLEIFEKLSESPSLNSDGVLLSAASEGELIMLATAEDISVLMGICSLI